MKTLLIILAAGCTCLTLVPAASAQQGDGSVHSMESGRPATPFARAMSEAMQRMDRGMAARLTGDPDRDFAAMMIPHHQGAIDMAKAELQFGRDPVLRRLAQGIIVEQQQEIEVMRRQLERLPGSAAKRDPAPMKPRTGVKE